MRLTLLNRFVKKQFPGKSVEIHNQHLVIDGDYFRSMYKKSLCPDIPGGEYDRFASYLRNNMNMFIESGITCHVVFKGAKDSSINYRLEVHQKIINKTDAVLPGREENEYCEPIFAKDVIKEVLNELNIEYHVCTYDEKSTLFSLANQFKCPILTHSIDYTVFRVSCILPNSIHFDKTNKLITCTLFEWQSVARFFPSNKRLMATLIAAISEDASYYSKIPGIIRCQEYKLVPVVTAWIRKKSPNDATRGLIAGLDGAEEAELLSNIAAIESLFCLRKYVGSDRTFEYLVATGKVATPYINLKNQGVISGSWLVVDKDKPDAMLSAMDIVIYSYAHLTGAKHLKISFVGRQNDGQNSTSKHWKIIRSIHGKPNKNTSYFQLFLSDNLPGFDMNSFKDLPEDCWLLLTTLVFYNLKNNFAFNNGAYAMILSYVLLSVVSDKIGLIKRSNITLFNDPPDNSKNEDGISDIDCLIVANRVLDMFYISEQKLRENFSREILHSIAEFQHCLQHMNYLNTMSGNVMGTCYHKSINMTLVYNVILSLTTADSPMAFVKKLLGCPSVFSLYKRIVDSFLDSQRNVFT